MGTPNVQPQLAFRHSHIARNVLLIAISIAAIGVAIVRAQTSNQSEPQIVISQVLVEPAKPEAATLCTLRVELENRGDKITSQLEFRVQINGADLTVYDNQVFMVPLPAGETVEVKLYNFWSTETSRQIPKNGRLNIEVTLVAAQRMSIEIEQGVEVWEPLGPVAGLPVSQSTSISMKQ